MKTTGNTILVTGGASGIGRALAERWHAAGNRVIIAGRRKEAIDAVLAAHAGMAGYVLDLEDSQAIKRFAEQVVQDHPALNVLVNNAGIMVAESMTEDAWLDAAERTVATNLLGPLRLTAALMPHLRHASNPAIVNVSSGLAFVPLTRTPTYSATKAAVHSWSLTLRARLKDQGIEVIELAPPAVQTDLMPGQATNPNIMTLAAFTDETMALFAQEPTPAEITVQQVLFLRNAEREGRFDKTFEMLNQAH